MPTANKLFASLLQQRLEEEGLSVRRAAKRIRVAHTTLIRAIHGKSVDLNTLLRICEFLEIPPVDILGAMPGSASPLASQIAMVLKQTAPLAEAFQKAMNAVANGGADQRVVEEIAAYAAYRLSLATAQGKRTPAR